MDQPGLKGAVLRFWQRSYAADYLGYILLQLAYFGVRIISHPTTVRTNRLYTEQTPHNTLPSLLHPLRSSNSVPICRPRARDSLPEHNLRRPSTSHLLHSLVAVSPSRLPQSTRHDFGIHH